MPGYWAGASSLCLGGGSEVQGTIRPDTWLVYDSDHPAGGFDLPMNDLSVRDGEVSMNYEQHRAQLEATGRHYWLARCYRNYDGELDFYVEFKGDPHVYYYQLTMPDRVIDGETYEDLPNYDGDGIYPSPSQWYLATAKIYIRKYTAAEFAAIGTGGYTTDDPMQADDPMPAGNATDSMQT